MDPPQTTQATIVRRDRERDIRGPVGRVIVDDDHFPRQTVEGGLHAIEKQRDVGSLLIRGNYD